MTEQEMRAAFCNRIGRVATVATVEYFAFCEGVKMEREACSKICEGHAADTNPPYKAHEDTYLDGWLDASTECVWAIRERSNAKVEGAEHSEAPART